MLEKATGTLSQTDILLLMHRPRISFEHFRTESVRQDPLLGDPRLILSGIDIAGCNVWSREWGIREVNCT